MVTRLSGSDASFYHLEDTSTPMYVGTLSILRKPRNGLSYESLLATVEQRLPQIPRYRQKVREVTLGLARPVWVDDRDFDITYHIRRSALPSPGSDAQLHELIARIGSRPLDKSRPLWEMYLIEGLTRSRIAIYTKSHQALVNGMTALEIGHVVADRRPAGRGRAPVRRCRAHLRPRHRAEQPAEHDCVAQPPLHGGRPSAGGLPPGPGALRLRRQRRCAGRGCRGAAQLADVPWRAGNGDDDRARDGPDVGLSGRGPRHDRAGTGDQRGVAVSRRPAGR